MNAAAMRSGQTADPRGSAWDLYKGWFLGLILIVIVLSVGAGLWLHFHP